MVSNTTPTKRQPSCGLPPPAPLGTPLAAGASTTYTCTHVLDEADRSAGSYSNTATVTGTPREREGSPVTHTSNTVVVKVPAPAFSVEKLQEIEGGAGPTRPRS